MFQQLLASKHHRLRDSKFGRVEAWVCSRTSRQKKKPRVNHEPRSAHGRAVNNKPRVNLEPRSAHGRAVNNHIHITLLPCTRHMYALRTYFCTVAHRGHATFYLIAR